jgi:hypothetical protein
VDYLSAPDPGSHIDPLDPARAMEVVDPGTGGADARCNAARTRQDLPEVSFAVDKQVVEALASQRSYISFRKRVRPG